MCTYKRLAAKHTINIATRRTRDFRALFVGPFNLEVLSASDPFEPQVVTYVRALRYYIILLYVYILFE